MSSHIGALLEQMLVSLWRLPVLNKVWNAALAFMPLLVAQWVEKRRSLVRAKELHTQIVTRVRLVEEEQFREHVASGLRALIDRHGRDALGDYLEFGVYEGTSLTCVYRELEALHLDHVRLFGFDSFQGFPSVGGEQLQGLWQPGRCYSPIEFTTAVLEHEGIDRSRVTLVPGWFTDTLNAETVAAHRIAKASLIMVDCDLYVSSRQALDFCAPLIQDEALIVFDEFHVSGHGDIGEKRAMREFLSDWGCFEAVPFGRYVGRAQSFFVSRRAGAAPA